MREISRRRWETSWTPKSPTRTGSFVSQLQPFSASIVPQGFSVKAVQNPHPHSGYEAFSKAVIKRIASALGISYNSIIRDYETVNYSSLRQSATDDKKTFDNLTRFLIESWKNRQYEIFLQHNYPDRAAQLLENSRWQVRKDPYVDILKDVQAVSKKMQLGLTNPIIQLENAGMQPEQVLKTSAKWKDLLKKYGLEAQPEVKQQEPVQAQEDLEEDEKVADECDHKQNKEKETCNAKDN